MDSKTYDSIKGLVDYLYTDEQKHYEESGKPANHIFLDVLRVQGWIDETAKEH